jgi:hypothetical protein
MNVLEDLEQRALAAAPALEVPDSMDGCLPFAGLGTVLEPSVESIPEAVPTRSVL